MAPMRIVRALAASALAVCATGLPALPRSPLLPMRAAALEGSGVAEEEQQQRTARARGLPKALAVRGGSAAFDWVVNIGTPAALIGGAAIANLIEVEDKFTEEEDDRVAMRAKYTIHFLLFSSFMMEMLVVFMSQVTGTSLLNKGADEMTLAGFADSYEFNYLAIRVCFFQGLLNWLGAIGLQLSFYSPEGAGKQLNHAAKNLKLGIGYLTLATMFLVLGFYNFHISHYENYGHMLWRLISLTAQRYILPWPPRVMPLLACIPFLYAILCMTKSIVAL